MGVNLPELDFRAFAARLGEVAPAPLPSAAAAALFAYYGELRRWAPSLSLIGPGTVEQLFARHFGESLAVLPWLPAGPACLLDVGSGAGFPGLVIAAARPDHAVTLVEARERKWAFLEAASRRAGLSCRCLNARVEAVPARELPPAIAALTLRAIRLSRSVFEALLPALRRDARLFLWGSEEAPDLPADLVPGRTQTLLGSERRVLREYWRRPPAAHEDA